MNSIAQNHPAMDRRHFVAAAATTVATIAMSSALSGCSANATESKEDAMPTTTPTIEQGGPYAENTGKPVRIISIGFTENRKEATAEDPWPVRTLDEMVGYIEDAATPDGQDLILLPELWPGASTIQTIDGEIITKMGELAKKFKH